MRNTPTEEQLSFIPELYATEHIPMEDKIVRTHFYIGQSHWFIVEYDQVDTMFGFCILNGDLEMAEFGYVGFKELKDINILEVFQVEYDFMWQPKPVSEVELIRRAIFYA